MSLNCVVMLVIRISIINLCLTLKRMKKDFSFSTLAAHCRSQHAKPALLKVMFRQRETLFSVIFCGLHCFCSMETYFTLEVESVSGWT